MDSTMESQDFDAPMEEMDESVTQAQGFRDVPASPAAALPPQAMTTQPPFMPPTFGMMVLPPLPPNWSQHLAPDGKTAYYYNNLTKQSTYTRPQPSFFPNLMPSGQLPPPSLANQVAGPSQPGPSDATPKKKEKPKEKIPIPGTSWTKVITNQGNVFYTEKESKRSSWTVPEEIKTEVQAYENEVQAAAIKRAEDERKQREEERIAVIVERDRIKKELEKESRARQEAEEKARQLLEQEKDREREKKRKEREEEADQDGAGSSKPAKLAKVEANGQNKIVGDEADHNTIHPEPGVDDHYDSDDEGQAGPLDEDDEEAWQKAVAAEIAAEHKIEEAAKKAAKLEKKQLEEEARRTVFAAPAQVDLTVNEGKALFKALLFEKDISPFAPWESALPLFINDPRYILLSSLKDRQDTFDDYCREAARLRRLNKAGAGKPSSAGPVEVTKNPEKEFRDLLQAEVKSTRTLWEDFRRSWRKDRRFFEYGKEDRAREKLFRQHLKEMGERKRADAQKAEQNFLDLLREHAEIGPDSSWKEVKQPLVKDSRYDAVGSSSLREELFNKHRATTQMLTTAKAVEQEPEGKPTLDRKARAEASLKEREAKVRGDRMQMERQLYHSKVEAGREEGEAKFRDLLLQAVRDHDDTYLDLLPRMQRDPRFSNPTLTEQRKQVLFRERVQSLAQKRLADLHKLFSENASRLDTPFEEIYAEIINDPAVQRLQLSPEKLKEQFSVWQRARWQKARQEFDVLLQENKFVDFWGRLQNKTIEETTIEEDEDHHDAELEGGSASLVDLAKQIDVKAINDVLQNDSRYRIFDCMREEREGWLKEWIQSLAAAQASVHAASR